MSTFKLTGQAHVDIWKSKRKESIIIVLPCYKTHDYKKYVARTAVGFIRVVLAVVVSVTDVGRVGTDAGSTLELSGSALKLSCSDKPQHKFSQNYICFNYGFIFYLFCVTHGSLQVHLIGHHSRPQCRTSTRREYTYRSCKQTEGTEEKCFHIFSFNNIYYYYYHYTRL